MHELVKKIKHLSRTYKCSKCNQPILDEVNGYTLYDEYDRIIAFYCESCGKNIKEEN